MASEDSTRYIIFSACGYGNVGDDAIMLGTARYLITRRKAKDLFVFSYSPKETQLLLEKSGLTDLAMIRSGHFSGLLRTWLSRKKKRLLIGGGTLITNRTFFTLYYLIPAILFRLVSSDIHFFGVAAEEAIRKPLLRFVIHAVLRLSIKSVSVRDDFTKDVVKSLASRNTEVSTIGDPALYLKEWGTSNEIGDGDGDRSFEDRVQILVSARDVDPRSSDYHAKCFADMLDGLIEAAIETTGTAPAIIFLPFCVHKTSQLERDDLFGSKIRNLMKYPEHFRIEKKDDPIEMMRRFEDSDLCICMRLHSLIFAFMTQRRCLAISYSPKVYNFAKDNGLPYFDIGELEQEKERIIDNVLEHLLVLDKTKEP